MQNVCKFYTRFFDATLPPFRIFSINKQKNKQPPQRGALRKEVRLSFIRQRRVILLRSDIRLQPSVIRSASLGANKISLKP